MTEGGWTDWRNRVGVRRRNVGVNRRYVGANRRYVGVGRRCVGANRRYVGVGRRDVRAKRRCIGVGMDVTLWASDGVMSRDENGLFRKPVYHDQDGCKAGR